MSLFTCLLTLEGDIPPKQYIIILFIIVVCGAEDLFYKTLISLINILFMLLLLLL